MNSYEYIDRDAMPRDIMVIKKKRAILLSINMLTHVLLRSKIYLIDWEE